MEKLKDSIVNFIQVMNTYPRAESQIIKSGGVRYRSELIKQQTDEKIHLSPELQFFYGHCEIVCDVRNDGFNLKSTGIDMGNGLLELWSPEHLVDRQVGYRWIGINLKENPDWHPFWLVIADINDDPIVVVTDQEHSPVMAFYEAGDLFPIAHSFADFLDYLSIMFTFIHETYAGEIIDDESCECVEGFIEALKERLSEINPHEELVSNFIDYFYG
ncbi:hypothetical protein [Solibacillus sp. FSL K6-1523]|uniref:hypothetical protein n=1 Tax=Solibacillus sp. FSL K6-1523 TaxID=2921471 RepID=UPI0030F7E2FC